VCRFIRGSVIETFAGGQFDPIDEFHVGAFVDLVCPTRGVVRDEES
jgi:hypothetical protein